MFIAVFITAYSITKAQISKEGFEAAIDYFNCKTVEITLEDDNLSQYKEQCPCTEVGHEQIIQFLAKRGNYSRTIKLSNEIESLKREFKTDWKKDDAINFLSEEIFKENTRYPSLYAFAEKRKNKEEFNKYKQDLRNELNITLSEVSRGPVDNTNYSERIDSNSKEPSPPPLKEVSESGFLGSVSDYLVVIAIILATIALILSFRMQSINKVYETLLSKLLQSRRLDDYIQDKIDLKKPKPHNPIDSSKIEEIQKRVNDLEVAVKKLNENLNVQKPLADYSMQQPFQEVKQTVVRTEIFYLSTPNTDGSFNESSTSQIYREGATIYRFTKISSNRAKFQIDEKDASVKLALQYPDKNIDPVCDAENAFNPKASRIVTIQAGEAELQGDKWIKTTKAKIRYEN